MRVRKSTTELYNISILAYNRVMGMPSDPASPRFLCIGRLRRDFALYPDGRARLDVPGGNLLSAAAGLILWEPQPPPGLVARVGEDYPQTWLEEFTRRGCDTRGIRVLPQAIDLRSFYVYTDRVTRLNDEPIVHFARLGLPFPKVLLGYANRPPALDNRTRFTPLSLRQSDVIPAYLEATAVHLCPLDYLSHTLLPPLLRQHGFTLITLDPAEGYMNAIFRDQLPALLSGLSAFFPSEEETRALFKGQSSDLREMAEALATWGCEIIVIKRGERGQLLYDSSSRTHWEIPAYPARLLDPTGAGDAFCGGFLAGYRRTYDPLQAVLHGNVSASLAIEGSGPFYPLDALPGLAAARLEALRSSARKL
jgi:sugar/nucleoside kinase (ribokinase family)